jgi:hypothetical protein
MDEAGVIRFNSDRKIVRRGVHIQPVDECLTAIENEVSSDEPPGSVNGNLLVPFLSGFLIVSVSVGSFIIVPIRFPSRNQRRQTIAY